MPFFDWKPSSSTKDTAAKTTTATQEQKLEQTNNAALIRRTEQEISPFSDESQHIQGQALTVNLDEDGKQRTQFLTDCSVQHRASLACIEEHYTDKQEQCSEFFDQYKQCRREETERRLARNKGRSFFG